MEKAYANGWGADAFADLVAGNDVAREVLQSPVAASALFAMFRDDAGGVRMWPLSDVCRPTFDDAGEVQHSSEGVAIALVKEKVLRAWKLGYLVILVTASEPWDWVYDTVIRDLLLELIASRSGAGSSSGGSSLGSATTASLSSGASLGSDSAGSSSGGSGASLGSDSTGSSGGGSGASLGSDSTGSSSSGASLESDSAGSSSGGSGASLGSDSTGSSSSGASLESDSAGSSSGGSGASLGSDSTGSSSSGASLESDSAGSSSPAAAAAAGSPAWDLDAQALVVVSGRSSDPSSISAQAHRRLLSGSCPANVHIVRAWPHETGFRAVHQVRRTGDGVAVLQPDEEPGSLSTATDVTDTVGLLRNNALIRGQTTALLKVRAELVEQTLNTVRENAPFLPRVLLQDIAVDELRAGFASLPFTGSHLDGQSVVYVIYLDARVTVRQALNAIEAHVELHDGDCIPGGVSHVILQLREAIKAGLGDMPAIFVYVGETVRWVRPGSHLLERGEGSPLVRFITAALNSRPRVAFPLTAATSARVVTVDTTDVEGAERRMAGEAVVGGLVRAVGPVTSAEERHHRTFVLIGLNQRSPGPNLGDPLRAAAALQSGEQGTLTLKRLLRIAPQHAATIAFLVDRVSCLPGPALSRDDVMALTAKQAFSRYATYNSECPDCVCPRAWSQLGPPTLACVQARWESPP
jgi:hypothetical protein